MEIKRVCALYFSATGNTEKTVTAFAETLAEQLGVPWERLPFTKPVERERDYVFAGHGSGGGGYTHLRGKAS